MAKQNQNKENATSEETEAPVSSSDGGLREINYQKTPNWREVLADGIHGSIDLERARIAASFYTERGAIPDTLFISDDGENPSVQFNSGVGDAIRTINTTVYFDLRVAIHVRDWLIASVDEIHKHWGIDEASIQEEDEASEEGKK